MGLIDTAIAFAVKHHGDTEDLRGEPYIWHPLRVALSLRAEGYSQPVQAVAILHDTVEDTEATLEDIETLAGSFVRDGVDAMTRRRNPDTGEWAETYMQYIERCCKDILWRAVKRHDLYDNCDPRRHAPGVPKERYARALEYIQEKAGGY